jgi:hypothetical protein
MDLNSVEKEDTIKMSSIFKKVNTIILEDHEYAIIGAINAIQVFEDYIFVLDTWSAKKLFVYDKTGKYVRQIGSLGQGPGEYMGIRDFCFDTTSKEIYLLDDWSKKVHKYNLYNGKYINSIKLPTDVTYSFIAYSGGKIYSSICHYDKEKSDNRLMEIDVKTGEYKEYLSAEKYNQGWNQLLTSQRNFFASKTEPLKYVELYMNTVIAISTDSIYSYLTMKHKDWVKKEDLILAEGQDFPIVQQKGKCEGIHNYFEWQDNIFFQYGHGLNFPPSVLYNKKNEELHHYKYLKNDLLFENRLGAIFLYVNSKAAYDYYNFSLFPLFYNAEDISKMDISHNLDKREELLKLTEEHFVIFEYEFK